MRFIGVVELKRIIEISSRRPVELKRMGDRWRGCCPFHSEDTGSFDVFADRATGKGRWDCKGCGKRGDGIDWLRDVEGQTWAEIMEKSQVIVDPVELARRQREIETARRRKRQLLDYLDAHPEFSLPDYAIEF